MQGGAYYFCYISEAKVASLLDGVQFSEQETSENLLSVRGGISAKILTLFGANAEFGKSKTLRVSQERHATLAGKLRTALRVLEQRIGAIPLLTRVAASGQPLPSGAYWYSGQLTVTKYDENYVYMKAALPLGQTLLATGSLKYFSDMLDHEGKYVPHSGNVDFFKGEVSPVFESIMFVLQADSKSIRATPLFLGLPLDTGLQL
jgi:hypothetical protein